MTKNFLRIAASLTIIAVCNCSCAKTDDSESYSSHASVPYQLEDRRLSFEQGNVKCDAAMLTDPERMPLEVDVYTVDRIRDIDLSVFLPTDKNPIRESDERQYRFFDGYQELMNDHYVYYTDEDYTADDAEPADISIYDRCFYYSSYNRCFADLDNYDGNEDLIKNLMSLQKAEADPRFNSIKSVWNDHSVQFYPDNVSYGTHVAGDRRELLLIRQQVGELPVIAPVNVNRVSSWEAEQEVSSDKCAVESPQIRIVDMGDQYQIARVTQFFDNTQPTGEKVKIKSPLNDIQALVDSISTMGSADPVNANANVEIYGLELGYIPVRENDTIKLVPVWAVDCIVRSKNGKVDCIFTTYLDASTLAISEYNY